MSTKILKNALYEFCKMHTEERQSRILTSIQDIQTALTSETKSSAGDKHETGRAMLQIEREKLGQQFAEVEKTTQTLAKISITNNSSVIGLGSLVKTSKYNYYLAISAGEFKTDTDKVFCISLGTPIGQLLLGKTLGDIIVFNENSIEILEVL